MPSSKRPDSPHRPGSPETPGCLELADYRLALFLFALVCALFARATGNGFVDFDDPDYLLDNQHVRAGLTFSGMRWAFTEVHAGNWHPVTWLSHMLDVELFGLVPGSHHLMSAVLHALNATLLFLFLRIWSGARGAALLVAALFACHPLRVESVVWASERKDVLAGTFWLLTLLAYGRYARTPGVLRMGLVVILFALGSMAKSMLVTLPFVLLLLDAWPLRRNASVRRRLLEKLPLFLMAAGVCVVTVIGQEAGGSTDFAGIAFPLRLENAAASILVYVRQTLWPFGLACIYPHAAIVVEAPVRALLPGASAGAGFLLLFFVCAWRARRTQPEHLIGGLWFLGTLIPVLGLVQVGSQAHADRYTYLPSIGLFISLVFGARAIALRFPARSTWITAALAVLGLSVWRTWDQIAVWENTGTLYRHALSVTERNYTAHNNYGVWLMEEGDLSAAEAEFESARAANPAYSRATLGLGILYYEQGDLERALATMEEAWLEKQTHYRTNLHLGALYLELGRLARAATCFERALATGRTDSSLEFNLGYLAQQRDEVQAATTHYRRSVDLDPTNADAWNNLGEVLLRAARPREAAAAFRELVAQEPTNPSAQYNLGLALEAAGQREGALAAYRAARKLDAGFAPAIERLRALKR